MPRAVAVLGAAYLAAASLSAAGQPGGGVDRLALLGLVVALGLAGVAGVFRERVALAGGALLVLVALGGANELLWDLVWPAVAALFVATLLVVVTGR